MSLKILIFGVITLYVGSTGMYIEYLWHFKPQFKWYDVIISALPIVRSIYLLFAIEDDDV
jgi:uncharacterized membrane protein